MWIQADQLDSVLKHHWYTTPVTESNIRYVLYHDRYNVEAYTLRFNLNSLNFNKENMYDSVIRKVMNHFLNAESVVGSISYDMLLVSNKDPDNPTYYVWRANSNQRTSSHTEETLLLLEQHQLYLFARRAMDIDFGDLNIDFRTSDVVIADILSVVFTFLTA